MKRSSRQPTISAEEAIERHLRANKTGSLKRFTSVIAGVYRLGGASGVVRWSIARIQQNIGTKYEQEQVQGLLRSIVNAERRGEAALIREWEEANEIEELAFQERQKRNRARLHRRAANRHMNDPRIQVRERLERSLSAASAPEPTSKPKGHSRQAKGECGQKLGRKLDLLIAEIQHEAACESSCCAAVIDPPADGVDPPSSVVAVAGGGSDDTRAPVEAAAVGGDGGFSNQVATVWDVMSGQASLMSDLLEFQKALDESPDLRAAATLRSLSRVRTELERIPETAAMGDPIQLRLQDVVVLMRQSLSRLR